MTKLIMKMAWQLAKNGQKQFGGSVKEYFSESLKIAWAKWQAKEAKELAESNKYNFELSENIVELEGSVKQVKWANDIKEKAIAKLNRNIEIAEQDIKNGENVKLMTEYLNAFKKGIKIINNISSAAFFIENRYTDFATTFSFKGKVEPIIAKEYAEMVK